MLWKTSNSIWQLSDHQIRHKAHWQSVWWQLIANLILFHEIDFREKIPILEPIKINNKAVDIVKAYKYLGSIIDNKLTLTVVVTTIDALQHFETG